MRSIFMDAINSLATSNTLSNSNARVDSRLNSYLNNTIQPSRANEESSRNTTAADENVRSVERNIPASQIDSRLDDLNTNLRDSRSELIFEKDESSGEVVFVIKNSETNETIRQIPTEAFLTVSQQISDFLDNVNSSRLDPNQSNADFPRGILTDITV
jgi:uncharacterized FlaG/YvyC family protein